MPKNAPLPESLARRKTPEEMFAERSLIPPRASSLPRVVFGEGASAGRSRKRGMGRPFGTRDS